MHAMALLLPLCALAAGEDTVALKEIGVVLPRGLANINYQNRQAFKPAALGYSVAYANKMCSISLIVYDHDKKDIPDGKASPLVEDQLKRSIADLKTLEERGLVKNVERMKEALPLPKDVLASFAAAGFTFDVKGGACKSYILLAGRKQHFLKVRVTQYVVDKRSNDAEVNAFLTALAKELTPAK